MPENIANINLSGQMNLLINGYKMKEVIEKGSGLTNGYLDRSKSQTVSLNV